MPDPILDSSDESLGQLNRCIEDHTPDAFFPLSLHHVNKKICVALLKSLGSNRVASADESLETSNEVPLEALVHRKLKLTEAPNTSLIFHRVPFVANLSHFYHSDEPCIASEELEQSICDFSLSAMEYLKEKWNSWTESDIYIELPRITINPLSERFHFHDELDTLLVLITSEFSCRYKEIDSLLETGDIQTWYVESVVGCGKSYLWYMIGKYKYHSQSIGHVQLTHVSTCLFLFCFIYSFST
jgi:hypothetical protein